MGNKSDFVPESFIKALQKGVPGFKRCSDKRQWYMAKLVWEEGLKRRRIGISMGAAAQWGQWVAPVVWTCQRLGSIRSGAWGTIAGLGRGKCGVRRRPQRASGGVEPTPAQEGLRRT